MRMFGRQLISLDDEKLTFTMANYTVSARNGADDIIFAELENFKKPQFVCNTPSRITINKI